MPKRKVLPIAGVAGGSAATFSTASASAHESANTDTQSSDRQAGTTPSVLNRPGVGFRPTMLLKPAGTRPEPAVSVPSAKLTRPGGDGDRRARTRAARNERRIERVARHAVGRAHADQAGGELVEVGLADDDGAGLDQALHDLGRLLRLVGEARAGGGRRQAGDVDIVLHREGHAVERQPVDLAAPCIEPHRRGPQMLVGQRALSTRWSSPAAAMRFSTSSITWPTSRVPAA